MPWVEQPLGPAFWEPLFVFDARRDQYSEMDTITYEDALVARYENSIWTEQPIMGATWVEQ
jgi:hypothetical protein